MPNRPAKSCMKLGPGASGEESLIIHSHCEGSKGRGSQPSQLFEHPDPLSE